MHYVDLSLHRKTVNLVSLILSSNNFPLRAWRAVDFDQSWFEIGSLGTDLRSISIAAMRNWIPMMTDNVGSMTVPVGAGTLSFEYLIHLLMPKVKPNSKRGIPENR